MPQTELDWVPLNIREESHDIRDLSDESIAAYVRLRNEYFSTGSLPTSDDAIKDIAKLEKPRQWVKVMTQLKRHVFNDGWRHPKWERALRAAEDRLADNRRKTAPARLARAANRQPAAPVYDDSEIPF
jgi:uncharacterized protein YdaU (DUF1376 family)